MRNKRVKQMICDVLNKKYGLTYCSYIGFEFEETISPVDYSVTKYGLHMNCNLFTCGTASLTADQLRGIN